MANAKGIKKNQWFDSIATSKLALPMIMAAVIGVGTSLLGVVFIHLIGFLEQGFFHEAPRMLPWLGGIGIILIPAFGGLLVGPLVTFLAPEAKGHGVPEVLKAIAIKGGKIRPVVVVVKAIASALAISTGSSVGREGPIVQIGSAFGSVFAQLLKLGEWRTKNMIACGAAAGIACVFNAPIAGVMFASEVILRDFGAKAVGTVVVAAVSSSIVSQVFLGESPAFHMPIYSLLSPTEMPFYILLGIFSAFAAHLFMHVLHFSEKLFEKWKFPNWLKPAIGGLMLGCIGYFFPQVFGSGLHPIEQALHGDLALYLLVSLIFLKMIATSISLGSGSSGGVFAPALFIGSMLGGAIGDMAHRYLPQAAGPSGAYALVGMASVFAAAAHAPVTAILIVFEMSRDYRMILPIMASVVIATSLSQYMSRESIYTARLKEGGIDIGHLDEVRLLGSVQVSDAMGQDFEIVSNKMPLKELVERISKSKNKSFYISDQSGRVTGEIHNREIQELILDQSLFAIAEDAAVSLATPCFADEPLNEVAKQMLAHKWVRVPVMDPMDSERMIGILRSEDIFMAYTKLSAGHNQLVSHAEQVDAEDDQVDSLSFMIPGRSLADGKVVSALQLPKGVILISITRKKTVLVPRGDTMIKAGDRVRALVTPETRASFSHWVSENGIKKILA